MPNTLSDELDTSISEILSKYGMEVANIIQYNNPDDVPDKYAVVRKAAKASLQALILRERLEMLSNYKKRFAFREIEVAKDGHKLNIAKTRNDL